METDRQNGFYISETAPADIPERKRKVSLRFSIWDAGFYSAMIGFGETYFVPLLVLLGATNSQIGIYAALPQLGVAFAQFFSIYLIEKLRVRKQIIVSMATIQAITLIAIFACILNPPFDPWTFIVMAVIYFAFNGVAIPAWNSLMGDITTATDRGTYFGRRSGLSQIVSFAAVAAAGVTLQQFTNRGMSRTGFAFIILAAFACRAGSIYSLIRHFEVPYRKSPDSFFSFRQFIQRGPKSNFAHFVFFVALMSLSVQIAAPYFAVYMIRDLGFSYFQYMIAQGVFIGVQFIAMRRWGPFADRYGNRMVLRITGMIMPMIPLLWLLSGKYHYVIFLQMVSGLAWAGWSLSSTNFIFDAVTPPKRARCAASLNFFNSMGIFSGAMIGAYLSTRAPQVLDTTVTKVVFMSPLNYLFLVSAAFRFAVVFIFMPTVHEVRKVTAPDVRDMFIMLTHVKALGGVRYEPFTGVDASHHAPREKTED